MGNPSDKRRWSKAVRYSAWFVAAIGAVIVVAALVLPAILDTPAVRVEIQRQLSAVVHGEVAWEGLSVRILPAPGGVLRKVRIKIPETANISAEQVEARLRLWPLLRGRAEIASVTLAKPDIRIGLTLPAVEEKSPEKTPAPDLLELYRAVMRPIADGIRKFAPDTVIGIENAELDISIQGAPPIQLSRLTLRARTGSQGMDLDATAGSPYWERLKLSARVQFADLSAKASLDATDLKPQAWLDHVLVESPVGVAAPRVNLSAQAHTDGKKYLACELVGDAGSVELAHAAERVQVKDVAVKGKVVADSSEITVHVGDVRIGASRLPGGSLRYSLKDSSLTGDIGYDLDLAQGMNATRRLVPASAGAVLSWFKPVTGRAQGRVKLALGRPDWSVAVHIEKSDAAIQVRDLPGPVRVAHANVEIDRHGVKISHAAASMPAGQVRLSTLRHSYKDGATAASAEFEVDLARGMELARRASGKEIAVIQSASGHARGGVKLAFGRKGWSMETDIRKADAHVQVKGLPGPAGLTSGSVRITQGSVRVDRAVMTLLDAKATASTVVDYHGELRVQGSIAEGTIGASFLEWVWKLAKAPPRLVLNVPISVTAPRFAWGPKGALDVNATARFPGGQSIAADLGWASGALDVRRATVKDPLSDAVIVVRTAGSRWEGQFSGALYGSSIAAVMKSTISREGSVNGKLRFAFDRNRPRDASAEGNLKGESLDLSWLAGHPARIERIDLAAAGASLRIREAVVNWAGQQATIRGEVKQGANGPVIDAQLDTPGIDVDALLAAKNGSKKAPAGEPGQTALWPLPVTGQFALRSKFLQRGRYRIAPVAATLSLRPERAYLELTQAQLCGLSLPLTLEATPGGLVASAKITAQKQQLQQTANCLADKHLLITGEFDLRADLSARGRIGELARNLKGSVTADMREGRVMKFALLGNILSMQNVAALLKEGGPRLDEAGFPYRRLAIKGRFDTDRFHVEESSFHSDAIGLVAQGWISLVQPESRLSVLVAPFSWVDKLVRSVPLVGYVVGGTFTSVPVGVSGDIRDPRVVPLGLGAVTSELAGIFERALKLPVKLVAPRQGGNEP